MNGKGAGRETGSFVGPDDQRSSNLIGLRDELNGRIAPQAPRDERKLLLRLDASPKQMIRIEPREFGARVCVVVAVMASEGSSAARIVLTLNANSQMEADW